MTGPSEPDGYVDLAGLRIAYRRRGAGPGVLLLNGTGESGATFDSLSRRLAARFECVATDARDTGRTDASPDGYTPRDLAADAAGVIDALALGPCHVIGFSLGGATAQELAIERPDVVRSLVLLSTWARSDAWFVAQMRNWQTIRRAHAADDEAFLRALEAWMFSPATFEDAGLVEQIRAMWDADEPSQSVEGWLRQTEADIAHDAAARLAGLDVAALVVVGEDDICTPPRYSEELCELLPNARLVRIARAGHTALFERPDEVGNTIEHFLTEAS